MEFNEQIELLEKEKEVLNDKYLRLAADFKNYKRNKEQQIIEIKNLAGEGIINELAGVINDIERALCYEEDAGLRIVYNKLTKILSDNGAVLFGERGDAFDSELHDAVLAEHSDDIRPGVVIDVANRGCKLNGKVIKYAKVSVSV